MAWAVTPHSTFAGVGASAAPEFPAETSVGDVGVSASIEIRNANSDDPDPADPDQDTGYTNTVCNEGDPAPCPPGGRGITLVASCGLIGTGVACDPAGYEPDVIVLDPTATGSGDCADMDFDVRLIDPLSGRYQFTPLAGNVELPGTGARCAINFSFDVVGFPRVDLDPNEQGVQTAQIVSSDQIVEAASGNSAVPASGDGTSVHSILRAQPALATTASAAVTVGDGGALFDTAMVTGRFDPDDSASIDFRAYGPDDLDCSAEPVFESLDVPQPAADGPVVSESFVPAQAGTYRWVATYSGDNFNLGVTGICGDPAETVDVAKAAPTLSTRASNDMQVDIATLTDTATVTDRVNPQASTINFRLYGPNDTDCSGEPAFESLDVAYPVEGGVVTSQAFTPSDVGEYRWIATYSGDANNTAITGLCNDPLEHTTVIGGTPTLEATSSDDIKLGAGVLFDTAMLSELVPDGVGGTIDFVLYGPDDPTCAGTPVFESLNVPVDQTSAVSTQFTPQQVGDYHWVVSFSGDSKNEPVAHECGEIGQTVTVMAAMPPVDIDASPLIVLGDGTITATATVTDRVNPDGSGTVQFRLFPPSDPTCAGTPIFVSEPIPYPIDGGPVTAPDFTPTEAGTYTWTVTHSGDVNNAEMSSACDDPAATVTVIDADEVELPATGRTTQTLALIGLVLLALGIACSTTARTNQRRA